MIKEKTGISDSAGVKICDSDGNVVNEIRKNKSSDVKEKTDTDILNSVTNKEEQKVNKK